MATVLIGENVPDLARGLNLLFTRAGHQTRVTVTGPATLAGARDDAPDLLVMNPALPGLDGLEVCRRLRADPATAGLPIIMLSVFHHATEVIAAYTAGADDYLGKPYDNSDLLTRAETLLHPPTPSTAGEATAD